MLDDPPPLQPKIFLPLCSAEFRSIVEGRISKRASSCFSRFWSRSWRSLRDWGNTCTTGNRLALMSRQTFQLFNNRQTDTKTNIHSCLHTFNIHLAGAVNSAERRTSEPCKSAYMAGEFGAKKAGVWRIPLSVCRCNLVQSSRASSRVLCRQTDVRKSLSIWTCVIQTRASHLQNINHSIYIDGE